MVNFSLFEMVKNKKKKGRKRKRKIAYDRTKIYL